jgi:hypothetical protein
MLRDEAQDPPADSMEKLMEEIGNMDIKYITALFERLGEIVSGT